MSPSRLGYATAAFALVAGVSAGPYPRDNLHDAGFGYIMERNCDTYCGADNQYCCGSNEVCYTSSGIALCGGGGGATTTTWTETHTYTSTSYYPPGETGSPGEDCVPPEGSGQIACGPICCAAWQWCSDPVNGQCLANNGATSWTDIVTTVTTQYSAPYRPTSGVTVTSTQTGTTGTWESATSTATGTNEPVGTGGSDLSGGAIAGIVIGTIAGVALLLLCCFCCIVKGLWNSAMAIFGLGRKKSTERVDVTEEYSHRPSSHAGRHSHGGWFGGGRPSTAASRKEKKSGGGLGWLAAGAGAAALLFGLKRHDKHKASGSRPPRSDYNSSLYYYSDTYTQSSPSSMSSSDRRTRRSRQSRATRTSRHSRPSRHSRV